MTKALLLLTAVCCACSPTAPNGQANVGVTSTPTPTPTPTPSPGQTSTHYRVSGTVRDEAGVPISNARVWIDANVPVSSTVRALTDGSGFYSLEFTSDRPFVVAPTVVAVVIVEADGFNGNVQPIPLHANDFVKSFWLGRPRTISAGEVTSIPFTDDSSICYNSDSNLSFTAVCEPLRITVPATGTLTVTARAAGAPKRVEANFVGTTESNGVTTFPVEAGRTYGIRVEVPYANVPVQADVTTSLQTGP